jgi:hypothetical protein
MRMQERESQGARGIFPIRSRFNHVKPLMLAAKPPPKTPRLCSTL